MIIIIIKIIFIMLLATYMVDITSSKGLFTRRWGTPGITRKRDHIKMRDYMDRRVTPPKPYIPYLGCPTGPHLHVNRP